MKHCSSCALFETEECEAFGLGKEEAKEVREANIDVFGGDCFEMKRNNKEDK